jgi:selenide,water dikinase
MVTGASARNWSGYGAEVAVPQGFDDAELALLTDPQTSGGLLVSCTPETVEQVLAIFRSHGFGQVAVIGEARAAGAGARLTVR